MISVCISINGTPIMARSAVNEGPHGDAHKYRVDDGSYLIHKRTDGAVKLAIALLGTIQEKREALPYLADDERDKDAWQREREALRAVADAAGALRVCLTEDIEYREKQLWAALDRLAALDAGKEGA